MTKTFRNKQEFEAYTISIKGDNPRLCIMPLRYFGKCWQCPAFETKSGKICESSLIIESEREQQKNLKQEAIELKERLKTINELMKKVK